MELLSGKNVTIVWPSVKSTFQTLDQESLKHFNSPWLDLYVGLADIKKPNSVTSLQRPSLVLRSSALESS